MLKSTNTQTSPAGQSVASVLDTLRSFQEPSARAKTPFATGFTPLDRLLHGGLRAHELTLIGGQPSVGKTVLSLQWGRAMALAGSTVVYVCYEHEESELMSRLLASELGVAGADVYEPAMEKLRLALRDAAAGLRSLPDILATEPLAVQACERLAEYASRLILVKGSGRHTDLAALEALVVQHGNGHNVLMVDYLQKVAVHASVRDEDEKVTMVAEGLKDLALNHDIAVVGITAATRTGLESQRLRLQHLRGSSALAYESDLVVLLNNKFDVVSKVHLAYDPVRAQTFRDYTVFSIEKNRSGAAGLDMEFRKDFANFRFDPNGGYVAERLVDERMQAE